MANGRLGGVNPAADTDTLLYTCPADTIATVTVSVGRRSEAKDEKVRIALTSGSAPTNNDWLEYDSEVNEITGIVLGAGQRIYVHTVSVNTVSFVAYGFEETA